MAKRGLFGVLSDDPDWVIHPMLAGVLCGAMAGAALFSASLSWWLLALGCVVGFCAGWALARLARSADRRG